MNDTNDNNNIYKNNDGESKTKLSFHISTFCLVRIYFGFHYYSVSVDSVCACRARTGNERKEKKNEYTPIEQLTAFDFHFSVRGDSLLPSPSMCILNHVVSFHKENFVQFSVATFLLWFVCLPLFPPTVHIFRLLASSRGWGHFYRVLKRLMPDATATRLRRYGFCCHSVYFRNLFVFAEPGNAFVYTFRSPRRILEKFV